MQRMGSSTCTPQEGQPFLPMQPFLPVQAKKLVARRCTHFTQEREGNEPLAALTFQEAQVEFYSDPPNAEKKAGTVKSRRS